MYVSGTDNLVANWFITVSPWTENEEIMEYDTFNSTTNTLNIIARGISPTAQTNTPSSTYYFDHYSNDEVRGDVNHLHIEEAKVYLLGVNKTYSGNNTHSGTNTFTWEVEVTTNMGIPKFANTGARDAAIPAPEGDEVCIVNGMFNWYNSVLAQWEVSGSSVPVPSASEGAQGTAETATQAEVDAATNTDTLFTTPYKIGRTVQKGTFEYVASTTGSDTYVATMVPVPAALVAGMQVRVKFTTANTGACTLNLNSLGATAIKLSDGTDPLDGDIAAGGVRTLIYDGTNFVLQLNPVRASTSDATTGTNSSKMMTPSTVKDSIKDSIGATSQFASSSSNSYDTGDQTAATALMVTVNLDSSGAGARAYATCNVGSATPSALIGRISTSADSNVPYGAFTFPVKSGYHWQVVITGTGSTNTTYIRTTPLQ